MFVAWRDLRFARGRFALMGTVVVLMTLLVVLLSGLTAGLGRESTSAITGLPVDHLAFGGGQKPSFTQSTVTEQQWLRWGDVSGVRRAEPLGISTARATHAGRVTPVTAFGVRPGSALAPVPERIAAGHVVLSRGAAEALGTRPGETLTVGEEKLTVVAVSGAASFAHTPVVWTDLADWQRLSPGAAPGTATVVALMTTGDADLTAVDDRLGTTTVSRAAALSAIGSYTSENGSLQAMRGLLFAISALVVGAFFTVWTIQRSGEIAVLKALGATTRYLLRDALGQALVVLVAGTAIGTAAAAGLGALASSAVPFAVTASSLALPAGVMVVLGALGAALSIRRITSVDPLTALGSAR